MPSKNLVATLYILLFCVFFISFLEESYAIFPGSMSPIYEILYKYFAISATAWFFWLSVLVIEVILFISLTWVLAYNAKTKIRYHVILGAIFIILSALPTFLVNINSLPATLIFQINTQVSTSEEYFVFMVGLFFYALALNDIGEEKQELKMFKTGYKLIVIGAFARFLAVATYPTISQDPISISLLSTFGYLSISLGFLVSGITERTHSK